jgi:rSAM/selenodomain-associated transferase 1
MADQEKDKAIIVFARFPVKGKVKTRLAKDLGIDFAAFFYKICAEHTFNEILLLGKTGVTPFLFCSEESEIDEIKNWSKNKFRYYSQQGNDLGERMLNAFKTIFDAGYQKIILVGTDTPGISAELMNDALNRLKSYKCVIGPSDDGGYYLVGLNSKLYYLFDGMEWSTDSVYRKTIESLKRDNQSYFVLEKLIDIDTKEDLKKWGNINKSAFSKPVKSFLESNKL